MQPVSLVIEGQFWDSQLYSGELILFSDEGIVHHINWSAAIDELATANAATQTALRVAFSDSDLFYTQKVRKILRDPAIESVIRQQLNALSALDVTTNHEAWQRFWRSGETPFNFLPTDTEIYYNFLIASGEDGMYSTRRNVFGYRRPPVQKHHDGRVLQVRASNENTAVAAAAGGDGLFEFAFEAATGVQDDGRHLAKRACSACDWAFQSIVAWDAQSAFVARFKRLQDPQSKRNLRTFDRILSEDQIFGETEAVHKGYVWGSHEKIFRITDFGLEVLEHSSPVKSRNRKSVDEDEPIDDLHFWRRGSLQVEFKPEEIVSTGTAPFGNVIELPSELIVIRSDGGINKFPGEVMHWRVFPRSEHYSNQLHIIYEDRLQIVSFVHDYFVDQTSKLTGFARGSNDYIVER